MKSKDKFKLFIWHGIRTDYTSGIGFAVGRTKEEAIEGIKKHSDTREWNIYAGELLITEPEVIEDFPAGGWISGGG